MKAQFLVAVLAVAFAVLPAQAAQSADQKIRAALLKRVAVTQSDGLTYQRYDNIYGETASLERGTDTTDTEGYDFYCRVVAEENLQLTAYRAGTYDTAASVTVALRDGEGVLTLEKGHLLFSCYLTE